MIAELTTPQPWLITEAAYLHLHSVAFGQFPQAPRGSAPSTDEKLDLQNGMLTIPVHGAIARRISPVTRERMAYYGDPVTLVPELMESIAEARCNPAVHTVLLDIDSPGGTVNGTPELAAALRQLAGEKHLYAYTAGQACSAAYWLASQCDAVYAAPSARVGSIGVILPLLNTSGLFQKAGLHMDVISAGKYKSAGTPGTSLSDEQRELLQQQVNETWLSFRAAVTARRSISAEDMEGQTFSGTLAAERGLVDACAYTLGEVQQKLLRRHGGVG